MTAPKYDDLVKRLEARRSVWSNEGGKVHSRPSDDEAEAAAAIRELVALRTVVQNAVDAGVVWRGERDREFQIPLHHYTAILVALDAKP